MKSLTHLGDNGALWITKLLVRLFIEIIIDLHIKATDYVYKKYTIRKYELLLSLCKISY